MASLDNLQRAAAQHPDLKELLFITGLSFRQLRVWLGAKPSVPELAPDDLSQLAILFCDAIDYSLALSQEGQCMARAAESLCQALAGPEPSDELFRKHLELAIMSAERAQLSALMMASRFGDFQEGLTKTPERLNIRLQTLGWTGHETPEVDCNESNMAAPGVVGITVGSKFYYYVFPPAIPISTLLCNNAYDVYDGGANEYARASTKLADAGDMLRSFLHDATRLATVASRSPTWWATIVNALINMRAPQRKKRTAYTTVEYKSLSPEICARNWKQTQVEYAHFADQIESLRRFYPAFKAQLGPLGHPLRTPGSWPKPSAWATPAQTGSRYPEQNTPQSRARPHRINDTIPGARPEMRSGWI